MLGGVQAALLGGSVKVAPPTDYTTGISAWFDFSDVSTLFKAVDLSTPCTTDADQIASVADKSGNNHYLNRYSVDGYSAVYKTGIQNGLSVGQSNGSTVLLTASAWSSSQPNTVFIVGKMGSTGAGTAAYTFIDGVGRTLVAFIRSRSTTQFSVYTGTAFAEFGTADTNPHLFSLIANGANTEMRQDGGNDLVATNTGAAQVSSPSLFGYITSVNPLMANSWIGEVRIYAGTALSTENREAVQNYLAWKWGLTIT